MGGVAVAVIHNEIRIKASRQKVWEILSDIEALDLYDPIVKKSKALTTQKLGLGAERYCDTSNGGWFKEKISVWNPYSDLEFSLYACNQPMKWLTHTYHLEEEGDITYVTQVMKYKMKFGIIGVVMDLLAGRRMADKGIKLFFNGLKEYAETGKKKN